VGCPSSDIARGLDRSLDALVVNSTGSGAWIDPERPFLLVIYHPVTTRFGGDREQVQHVLDALDRLQMQTVLMWPNIDAGSDHISKAIRVFRDQRAPDWLRTLTNLNPEHYLKVLGNAACAIGNSSSFVRDAGYFGTPVVLVGDRQEGREADLHAIESPPAAERLVPLIRRQLKHGRYAPSALYGDGCVSRRIAEALATLRPYVQKRLNYIYEDNPVARVNGHARTGNRNGAGRVQGHPAKEHYDIAG
jgi:UDP-N-acetylglucosamine 2-epimerase